MSFLPLDHLLQIDVDKYDEDKQKQNALLTIDGCSIEDLALDFQLPGYPDIEMMKNGCKIGLTVTNLGKYLNVSMVFMCPWSFVTGPCCSCWHTGTYTKVSANKWKLFEVVSIQFSVFQLSNISILKK